MKRRDFIKNTLAGAGGMMVAPAWSRAVASPKLDAFETVTLGQSKLDVSMVGIGTGVKGGGRASNQTRMGKEAFEKLLKGAFDRGIRLFDLADMYGTHPYLIPALKGIPRQDFKIVSKIWWAPGKALPEPERPDADIVVERFLKELGTDYIDLVHLHCVTAADWPTQLDKQMNILAKLKEKGLIRAHGVSCHSLQALEAAAEEPWVDSVHARINPYGVKMDGPPAAVVPVLRKIHAAGKGVVGMKIIGEGQFRNSDEKRNYSIDFALNLDCVDSVIIGFEKLSEVDDFTGRVSRTPRRDEPLPVPAA